MMNSATIVMTHDDYQRLYRLLEQMPPQDRRHFQDLQQELERAHRVDPDEIPPDVVTMGSTVHLRELETGETWTFTVCFPEDADIRENRLSILSPVGTAIIGCRAGDLVDWPVPRGTVRIRVEKVVYQPEAASHQHSLASSGTED
jgi:regulator of nucleoside diphosphate kinase